MKNGAITTDEDRQTTQHEAVHTSVQSHVDAEITGQAAQPWTDERAEVGKIATAFRIAFAETEKGDRRIARGRRAARGSQFLDYGFYVVYALLAVRLVLALIAARSNNGFAQLVRALTGPFYAPFRGIVPSPSAEGGFTLVVPILIAIAAYALLHAGINGLLRLVATRKTVI